MKNVIFFCLLSLTLCLAKPADQPAPPAAPAAPPVAPAAPPVAPAVLPSTADPKVPEAANAPGVVVQTLPQVETQPASPQVPPETKPVPTQNTSEATTQTSPLNGTTGNESKTNASTVPTDNKTTDKKEEVAPPKTDDKKVEPTKPVTPKEKSAETNPSTETKPAENLEPKKDTTSQPSVAPTKPTDAHKSTPSSEADEVKHVVQARGFDGPSFMGGIILTLGLLAVGFMGFKYYKNQTERNYHTL